MKLIITTGPMKGMEWTVVTADSTIGRDSACDFVLPDEALSRQHCRLMRQADCWTLIDLESMNGVRINGELQSCPRPLKHGDQIRMGQATLLVETDANRPLPRPVLSTAGVVATADKGDPWFFGMVVIAAALAVVALSLFFSMSQPGMSPATTVVDSQSQPGDDVPVASLPVTPLSVDPEAQTTAPDAELEPLAPVAPVEPPAAVVAAVPPAPTVEPLPAQQLCPACQLATQTALSALPPIGATVEAPTQVAQSQAPPELEPELVVMPPDPFAVMPMPKPRRDTLATDRLLRYSKELPLAEADAAAVVREFDRRWRRNLLDYPQLNTDPEIARHRRLKAKALSIAINRIAHLEDTASLQLNFVNSPDNWDPEVLPSPPVMSSWVPTKGLQGRAKVVHDGLAYEFNVKHEVKGYDYGYYEPGSHLIYRLTISVNEEVLLQKVYDLRAIPRPPTAGVLGPHDLPGSVHRTAANSLFRFYAGDCARIFAPEARVTATAQRDAVPVNYISRIPNDAWDYRELTISWRRNTSMTQWQRLLHEAIDQTFSTEFGGVAAQ